MKKSCAKIVLLALLLRLWSWEGSGGGWRMPVGRDVLAGQIVRAELGWRMDEPGERREAPGEEATEPIADERTIGAEGAETQLETAPALTLPVAEETPAPTPTPLPAAEENSATPKTLGFVREAITNHTSQRVDLAALCAEPLTQRLPAAGPQILILHTHATEAYTPDAEHLYTESDSYRTPDTAYNVVRVGDELASALLEQGFRVIHDRTLYDYPHYNGAYSRSAAATEQWLALYPEIAVVIDLHRDAMGEGEAVYKTHWEMDGESAAQVMLLVGTGEIGLEHPRWRENLKLALGLYDAMGERSPGLARPIELVSERYNQHYTTGSVILEVGSSGNTLPEALRAVHAFAEAAAPVLSTLK